MMREYWHMLKDVLGVWGIIACAVSIAVIVGQIIWILLK